MLGCNTIVCRGAPGHHPPEPRDKDSPAYRLHVHVFFFHLFWYFIYAYRHTVLPKYFKAYCTTTTVL